MVFLKIQNVTTWLVFPNLATIMQHVHMVKYSGQVDYAQKNWYWQISSNYLRNN